jgi:hypothetical protein
MKKLKDPKILIGAGVIVIAIIIFVMVMSGGDPSGGHSHTH